MNIVELLDEFNIPQAPEGHEHRRAGWAQIDCPFCSRDSGRFRMGINIQGLYANCWSCGSHQLPSVLRLLLGPRYGQAKLLLKGIRPERVERVPHTGTYTEPPGVVGLLGPHKLYIKRRGFDVPLIERLWHVRGIGISTQLSWRLFLPIVYRGQAVSWTTRTISNDPDALRYISAGLSEESVPHKHLLYGEDYCRHAIVVVEGPIDAWAGGPGFAATFGLSITNEQVNRIARYPVRAICFDNQPEARRTAKRLADNLSALPGETLNVTLDSKDPGEATQREIKRLRKEILE